MTAFRSTTDQMLAAKFDPQPYIMGGERVTRDATYVDLPYVFDPRPEYIPSRDPFVKRSLRRNAAPRYARPKPNPILVAFRESGVTAAEMLSGYVFASSGYQSEQIEHARRVLTKLAKVYA